MVLVHEAEVPPRMALPESLASLALVQAAPQRLRSSAWQDDVNAIERVLAVWGLRDEAPDVPATPVPLPAKATLPPISDAELGERLRALPRWDPWKDALPREHPEIRQELRRSYQFDSFEQAIAFMAAVAPLFTKCEHHPRWSNEWKTVHVRLSTWDARNRITTVDLDVAEKLDNAYRTFRESRGSPPNSGP